MSILLLPFLFVSILGCRRGLVPFLVRLFLGLFYRISLFTLGLDRKLFLLFFPHSILLSSYLLRQFQHNDSLFLLFWLLLREVLGQTQLVVI